MRFVYDHRIPMAVDVVTEDVQVPFRAVRGANDLPAVQSAERTDDNGSTDVLDAFLGISLEAEHPVDGAFPHRTHRLRGDNEDIMGTAAVDGTVDPIKRAHGLARARLIK